MGRIGAARPDDSGEAPRPGPDFISSWYSSSTLTDHTSWDAVSYTHLDVYKRQDWTALGAGAALITAALIGGAILLALAASAREAGRARPERSAVVSWLGRVAPVPVGLGARMALERGPGARSMPVRPALIGAVVGVLGVVGALTINAGIAHALALSLIHILRTARIGHS